MKAVVMTGGYGIRIQPLTHSRSKPMMEHTMMMLKDLDITEFVVLLFKTLKQLTIESIFQSSQKTVSKQNFIEKYQKKLYLNKRPYHGRIINILSQFLQMIISLHLSALKQKMQSVQIWGFQISLSQVIIKSMRIKNALSNHKHIKEITKTISRKEKRKQ